MCSVSVSVEVSIYEIIMSQSLERSVPPYSRFRDFYVTGGMQYDIHVPVRDCPKTSF